MSRSLLMQTLLAHMELLAERYPEKAALPMVQKAKRAAEAVLEQDRLEQQRMSIAPSTDVAAVAPKRSVRRAA